MFVYVFKTLKNEIWHIILGLIAAFLFYFFYHNSILSLISFLTSMLVDFDHLLEYYLAEGFSAKNFSAKILSGENFEKIKKMYLVFHAWEYIPILYFLTIVTSKYVFIALAFGLLAHYLVDALTNEVKPLTYFLTYRILVNFNLNKLGTRHI